MIKRVLFAVAIMVSTISLSAQVKFIDGDTDTLQKLSQQSGKMVFVDLYADWCPPCRAMDRAVFSREDVGEFMSENFISAKYSVDYEIGKAFSRDYQVRSIPTYLVFNTEGELVGRMEGGMSAEEFISNMNEMLKRINTN